MIPYLGEKSKYANFIIPNIPTNISTYCEPFGGAFSIFFCLELDKYQNTKFVYNDINELNYNLFKNLNNEDFIDTIQNTEASEDKYYKIQKEIYKYSDIDRAIGWVILLCCSSSLMDIMNGSYKNNSEFEILKVKLRCEQEYISRIEHIKNVDYKFIIKEYDSKDTFFYIDPPYISKEHYYINHNFNTNSHLELKNIIKNIDGRFALSCLDFKEIDNWYNEYRIIKNRTFMGTECLIMNY